jgi:hypothetical protein
MPVGRKLMRSAQDRQAHPRQITHPQPALELMSKGASGRVDAKHFSSRRLNLFGRSLLIQPDWRGVMHHDRQQADFDKIVYGPTDG